MCLQDWKDTSYIFYKFGCKIYRIEICDTSEYHLDIQFITDLLHADLVCFNTSKPCDLIQGAALSWMVKQMTDYNHIIVKYVTQQIS